jgi:hypothetical protein
MSWQEEGREVEEGGRKLGERAPSRMRELGVGPRECIGVGLGRAHLTYEGPTQRFKPKH